jgi:ferredoxin
METRKYVLTFPARLVDAPVTTKLVRECGITVNILRARVEPEEEGRLVVEFSGEAQGIRSALAVLAEIGVGVEPLERGIVWRKELCIDCGACPGQCPTGALAPDAETSCVEFDREKCIACELCVPACPYGAIEAAI